MMQYWLAVKAMKWLPYVIGAVALLVLVWRIYSAGFDSGWAQSEAIVQTAERATMLRHIEQAKAISNIDLEAVVVTATKKESIRYAIKNIIRTVDTCDSADWLREYNEAVRAASTGAYTGRDDHGSSAAQASRYQF